MKRIQITSHANKPKWHDKIYVPACCPEGAVVKVYTPNTSPEKSMACMIDVLNVKGVRVVIHQVSLQHSRFCSIIRSQGKESDASRKQTSQEMIWEIEEDRDKDSAGLIEGSKEMQAEIKLTSLKEVFLCS